MKKFTAVLLFWIVSVSLMAWSAYAEEVTTETLNARLEKLEEKMDRDWLDRIHISGLIEAEASHTDTDFSDPAVASEDESDIVLATVELGVEAEVNKHVQGHILFLFEEGENDYDIAVDEGYVTIDGKDVVPLYLNAGKFYLPFGYYNSHMITDPLTLEIGEINESAVQVGFANDWFDASVAVFNGDVDERGDDDHIDSYVASLQMSVPEGTFTDFSVMSGVSYISNIADSDGLEDKIATGDGDIDDSVAGIGAFISVSFKEMLYLEIEYIGAIESFQAGETSLDDGSSIEPSAWNVELAYVPVEKLEVAVRYEQTDDIYRGVDDESLPESQYGITVAYEIFDNTTVALEYLDGEYENDDEVSAITAQLAIEF